MNNPFKILEMEKEVPNELKNKVMDTIESVKLLTDLSSLFSANYSSVVAGFFQSDKRV